MSAIVLKLLEKEPERRYQTADALASDLEEAKSRLADHGRIDPFLLAFGDVPRTLTVPDKLYGRGEELRQLEAAAARSRRGARELVVISGAPGIGKSALVNCLAQGAAASDGLFIAGKFDQLHRSVPLSGLALAFQALARLLLAEPPAALASWRERIEAAVAPNGKLLVQIVPELERFIGPQPEVVNVGPMEAKNRFSSMMTRFLGAVAQRDYPLTLFLDDIQWMDPASLELLSQWQSDDSLGHLLLIGAYRDSEVDFAHPLSMALTEWSKAPSGLQQIHIGPLGPEHLAQLAADVFKADTTATQAMAALILRKTAGNPFFARP